MKLALPWLVFDREGFSTTGVGSVIGVGSTTAGSGSGGLLSNWGIVLVTCDVATVGSTGGVTELGDPLLPPTT